MQEICKSLSPIQRKRVKFNVNDPEHIKAFQMLCLGENNTIRQHPELRFILEENFTDVRSMLFHHVGHAYVSTMLNQVNDDKQ